MRKGIAFLLVALLALSSFAAVFAAEAQAPADVKDTRYEAAVTALMGKGILSGYPDGTFRPEWTISRAEACTIVVKAMAPSEEALTKAAKSNFPDLAGYDWAAKYINYASAKGVISGYPGAEVLPNFIYKHEQLWPTLHCRHKHISYKEIDGTLYIVESVSSRDAKETIEDKMKRYVVNHVIDDLKKERNTPQT